MPARIAAAAGLTLSAVSLAAPSFDAPTQLPAAFRPAGVAGADFNGDGLTDLAVAVDNNDRLDVRFGTGNGAFGAPNSIFTGSNTGPDALLANDVNGDGQPDLVVVLKNINQVRVYINAGGVFTPGSSAPTGPEPVSLANADLDADGDTDFVIANRDGNTFTVATNTGGALSTAAFPAGDEPRDAAPIDMDGDGLFEIAVSNHDDRTITIHASGSYALQQTLFVNPATRPDGLAVADLDGDGDSDLAAALSDDAFSLAATYTNTAGLLAAGASAITNGVNSSDIVAADFDLDGDADLATTNQDSNNISVMENTGAAFAPGVTSGVGTRPERLLTADLDNNGSPDIAVTNRDSNDTWTFMSQASGAPQPCGPADLAEPFQVLDLADVQAFVTGFQSQNAAVDLAAPQGVFDLADIQAFVGAFGTGCPL